MNLLFYFKLIVARVQVRRFCDAEALPHVDRLAGPLAFHRSLRDLLFREPGILRIYFGGRSKDKPIDGIGCDCCEVKS